MHLRFKAKRIQQIMVRTRGLHWVLGKVLGRALGRQVSGDEEESPQRRWLITLACR